jgi:hypothetical protein
MRAVTFAALFSLIANGASAATFCVVNTFGTNCSYFDYPTCQQAAEATRGTCVVGQGDQNPLLPTPQTQPLQPPFCVVSSVATQCWYYDAPTCQQAAQAVGGACIVNPNR